MVKNVTGGNKHKSHARKHTTAKPSFKLRIAEVDGELYGIVTKMLGNGMFYVHCIDNILRLGHIRGKFSGRGKRDNFVEPGKWVLVGEREWDIKNDGDKGVKIIKCDLLEVYNDLDKERLIDKVSENWSVLYAQDVSKTQEVSAGAEDVHFVSEKDEQCEKLLEDLATNKVKAIDMSRDNTIEDVVDWMEL